MVRVINGQSCIVKKLDSQLTVFRFMNAESQDLSALVNKTLALSAELSRSTFKPNFIDTGIRCKLRSSGLPYILGIRTEIFGHKYYGKMRVKKKEISS